MRFRDYARTLFIYLFLGNIFGLPSLTFPFFVESKKISNRSSFFHVAFAFGRSLLLFLGKHFVKKATNVRTGNVHSDAFYTIKSRHSYLTSLFVSLTELSNRRVKFCILLAFLYLLTSFTCCNERCRTAHLGQLAALKRSRKAPTMWPTPPRRDTVDVLL